MNLQPSDAQVEAAVFALAQWCPEPKPDCYTCTEQARAVLEAALPLIETQLREQIANEIQSHADYAKKYEPDSKFLVGLDCAARVVRGTTNQESSNQEEGQT